MIYNKDYQNISLEDIDFKDFTFRLNCLAPSENLYFSIKSHGLLEPVVLQKKELNKYLIIFGFRRLEVLKKLGEKSVQAILLDKIKKDDYLRYIFLKNFKEGLSAVSKIKLISILEDNFEVRPEDLISLGKKKLNIPEEFIGDQQKRSLFFKLPLNLLDYLAEKKIGFRLIDDLLLLPPFFWEKLSAWISITEMRVNFFKKILDLLIDIWRRDKKKKLKVSEIKKIEDNEDRKVLEEELYKNLFKIRYPEYSSLKRQVENLKEDFLSQGIHIDFPEFFEGEQLNISFGLFKNSQISNLKDKMDSVDYKKIKKLLELL